MVCIRTPNGWIYENARQAIIPTGDESLPIMYPLGNGIYWAIQKDAVLLFSIDNWTSISLSLPLLDFCSIFYKAAVKTTGGSCACNGMFEKVNVYGKYNTAGGIVLFSLKQGSQEFNLRGELLETFSSILKEG